MNSGVTITPMFEALRDELSLMFSWRWPTANGEVLLIESERIGRDRDELRLCVVYQFYVGDDGPYTGEAYWSPLRHYRGFEKFRISRRKLRKGTPVQVRYREDDPSVNTLDGGVGRYLE